MGKKSKKGQSRASVHHGKAKRASQAAKKRSTSSTSSTAAASVKKVEQVPKPDVQVKKVTPPIATPPVASATPTPTPIIPEATKPEPEPEPILVNESLKDDSPKPQESAVATKKSYASAARTNFPEIALSKSTEEANIPKQLLNNLHLLSPSQTKLANALCKSPTNQSHIFNDWSIETREDDSKKIEFMGQLVRMDEAYPSGGLVGYIRNARGLLEKSKLGENPLEGWAPSVPDGEMFEIGTKGFDDFEKIGMEEIGKCGFTLVAGGLGERLGYSGIKLGLPTELATETSYLQYYIETILAIQSRYAKNVKLPLCIMVSNDTNAGTVKLLQENKNFGMADDQITIVQQGDGVPALMDNDATIAIDSKDPYKIQAKPHGHGDIHALLHSQGVCKDWCAKGLEWVIFFQDTNGLAFHTLALALGVSKKRNLIMNSIAVPRKGKQAVGGVTKLTKASTGEERTINVEYNQLDPLLRANGYPDGDVNDEKTGFSPFPGNINQLLFQLKPYSKALQRTKGAMPEFVNPKYADAAKTIFKKPTRLECMMQDFPTILDTQESKQVGFTSIVAELCFSPVKNATADGVALQSKGTAPGVAATGEADQYAAIRKIMTSIGCQVEEAAPDTYSGITVVPGPEIVLKPSFAVCPAEYKKQFPEPSKIKISARSSLVLKGSGVIIESLDLDGALVIECEEGATGVIRDLVVQNKGWVKVVDDSSDSPEYIRIRGYHLNKTETKTITFKKDGSIDGYSPVGSQVAETKEEVKAPKVDAKVEKNDVKSTLNVKTRDSHVRQSSKSSSVDIRDAPDLSRPSTPEVVITDSQNCCCIC